MACTIGMMTLEEAAHEAAGNWRNFECFVWFRQNELEDADDRALIYTHNRDSGLLAQSNASVIAKTLEPFAVGYDPEVVFESHSHWAVGHVDGFSVRVFRNGVITEAFKVYHGIEERIDDYPVLDEEDYSRREYEATLANLTDAAWRLKDEYELPEGWESDVYDWLAEHDERAVENVDDQGGYPSEEQLRSAFEALAYKLVV